MKYTGKIVKWNEAKGYGFIADLKDNSEVFFHISDLAQKWKKPDLGDRLRYEIAFEPNGKSRALNIENLDVSITETSTGKALFFTSFYFGAMIVATGLGKLPSIILEAYLLMGLITFILYGLDKKYANANKRRISENTLHLFALMFGWLGAAIAQQWFRHKTIKIKFRYFYYSTAIANVAFVIFLLLPRGKETNAFIARISEIIYSYLVAFI